MRYGSGSRGGTVLLRCLCLGAVGLAPAAAIALEDPPVHLLTIGSYGSGPGQFYLPHGLSTGDAGHLYVADAENHRISVFTWGGAFIRQWGSYGTGPGQFHTPWNVLASRSGHVYVTQRDGSRVQKFTADGTFVLEMGSAGTGDGQFGAPWGITEDDAGVLYISDWYARIQKFTPEGTYLGSISGSGLVHPHGLAVRNGSILYVLDGYANRVDYFTTGGQFLGMWTGIGNPRCCPFGIAIDASGDILVADTWIPDIKKYTPTGVLLAKWGTGLRSPHGICVDGNGDIYIADALNRVVQKYSGSNTAPVPARRTTWGRIKQVYR